MTTRRELLLALAGTMLLPRRLRASMRPGSWQVFMEGMYRLAAAHAGGDNPDKAVATRGIRLLRQLDVSSEDFARAVSSAYESGNRFWLWQRLISEPVLNGGVLTVERGQDVPLHDHPGATGLLRVLRGELELWQFDRLPTRGMAPDNGRAELQRVTRRVLYPGDTATLSPRHGNIHALRSRGSACSMLDYFIPPYRRSARNWYEPLAADWHDGERITCRVIPEHEFYAP